MDVQVRVPLDFCLPAGTTKVKFGGITHPAAPDATFLGVYPSDTVDLEHPFDNNPQPIKVVFNGLTFETPHALPLPPPGNIFEVAWWVLDPNDRCFFPGVISYRCVPFNDGSGCNNHCAQFGSGGSGGGGSGSGGSGGQEMQQFREQKETFRLSLPENHPRPRYYRLSAGQPAELASRPLGPNFCQEGLLVPADVILEHRPEESTPGQVVWRATSNVRTAGDWKLTVTPLGRLLAATLELEPISLARAPGPYIWSCGAWEFLRRNPLLSDTLPTLMVEPA